MGSLILTRRTGEIINIGNDITVQVMGVVGNQVRIGVTAPKDVAVDRQEIRDRKNAGLSARKKSALPQ